MLALHSIGARPCSAAGGGLNARTMTHLAAGATHTMTPVGQEGHGNVLGGMPRTDRPPVEQASASSTAFGPTVMGRPPSES
jgi:hypothetical protein